MSFLHPTPAELADSAVQKKINGEAITWPIAIRKAIRGAGILDKNDIRHKTPEVARELQRRGVSVKRAKKRTLEIARAIRERLDR